MSINSKFDLVTTAMQSIGGNAVFSFSDGTKEAQVSSSLYDVIVDFELTDYAWNFNATYAELSKLVESPSDPRYQYQYQLPSDHLNTKGAYSVAGVPVDYVEASDKILSNASEVHLKYQRRVDVDEFPPQFQLVIISRLSYEFSKTMSGDLAQTKHLFGEYSGNLNKARSADARSNRSKSIYSGSNWLRAFDSGS